jgi:hypothetical protein
VLTVLKEGRHALAVLFRERPGALEVAPGAGGALEGAPGAGVALEGAPGAGGAG